jgi:hypothetical protein
MNLDTDSKCKLLVERIASVLGEGIHLGPDAVHFIDSTFSNPSTRDLAVILQDESNCERDSLFDLIFFPDETIQVKLENLLEKLKFEKNEEGPVRKVLLKKELQTAIHFQDARKPLNLQMPPSIADQFISRLHITKQLEKELVDSINKHVSKAARALVKVKFRNARKTPTRDQLNFLSAFLEKMGPTDEALIACLELLLDVLADLADDADIFSGLMARKKHYVKSLKAAEKFEEQLKTNNIETLMLQGEKAPYINRSDAVRKLARIDEICIAVFGKTQQFDPVCEGIRFDGQNTAKDLRRVINLLTGQ